MSEPKVIYLGPACEVGTGDGRTWAEDNPWPDCECGHRPVQYVLGDTYDRMKAERDALQLRLNAADQRIDELVSAVRSINRGRSHEIFVPGDDEPQYRQRKEWVDWVLSLCDEASASEPCHEIPGTSGMRLNMLATYVKREGRFLAVIGLQRKKHSLGSFDTAEEAGGAYAAAAETLHGEFSRT